MQLLLVAAVVPFIQPCPPHRRAVVPLNSLNIFSQGPPSRPISHCGTAGAAAARHGANGRGGVGGLWRRSTLLFPVICSAGAGPLVLRKGTRGKDAECKQRQAVAGEEDDAFH